MFHAKTKMKIRPRERLAQLVSSGMEVRGGLEWEVDEQIHVCDGKNP